MKSTQVVFRKWNNGDKVSPDKATHFVPEYLSGSDYSGSTVEQA